MIKTSQKCLIFWNLLGTLINKVLQKIPNLSFIRFIFRNYPKIFAIVEFIWQLNKSAYEKLNQ